MNSPPIVIEPSLKGRAPELLREMLPPGNWAIVCDSQTYGALAERVFLELIEHGPVYFVNLGKKAVPRIDIAENLRRQTAQAKAIIAIGSGTINDLCKYIAFRHEIPYVVFPTAPSMNGYVSPNASLIFSGYKSSVAATLPKAVLCDMEVIASAPRRLLRAGLGDSICRPTVQADMLLSHLLFGTPYPKAMFDGMIERESEIFAHAEKLTRNDPTLVRQLLDLLLYSGQCMREFGSSAPASQGEHMIAHVMESLYGTELHDQYHGEQIGITTLAMAHIQHKVLLRKPMIKPMNKPLEYFLTIFGKAQGETLYHTYQKKVIDKQQAEALQTRLDEQWPDIRAQLEAVMIRPTKLDIILRSANCPTKHEQIGWHKDRFEHALTVAHFTRNRFTFLDLAAMRADMRYWFS